MKKIVLVSCGKTKLPHKARAEDLYTGQLFKLSLAFARSLQPDKIFILSAKHGLLDPKQKIEPYDQTLNTMRAAERKKWAQKVRAQMEGEVDFEKDNITFLAGKKYTEYLEPFFKNTNNPLEGLRIGEQLSYLKNKTTTQHPSCGELHTLANKLRVFTFPFDETKLPHNGIYVVFEKGEKAHGARRIVRVGTHDGQNRLGSRLREHFLIENKDRSIFRKNIGRALLNKDNDPFLEKWDWDLTSRKARNTYSPLIDFDKQKAVEQRVTSYIKNNFNFVVLQVENKGDRRRLESRLISTVSLCSKCRPSKNWLGVHSTKDKIRESGLWLVQGLYKEPLSKSDFEQLEKAGLYDNSARG